MLGEVTAVAQDDNDPLLAGQPGQQPEHLVAVLDPRISWRWTFGECVRRELPPDPAGVVGPEVDEDAPHVGQSLFLADPGPCRARAHQGLPGQFAGAVLRSGEEVRGAQQLRLSGGDERREGLVIELSVSAQHGHLLNVDHQHTLYGERTHQVASNAQRPYRQAADPAWSVTLSVRPTER